jgi:hypothetical protein
MHGIGGGKPAARGWGADTTGVLLRGESGDGDHRRAECRSAIRGANSGIQRAVSDQCHGTARNYAGGPGASEHLGGGTDEFAGGYVSEVRQSCRVLPAHSR